MGPNIEPCGTPRVNICRGAQMSTRVSVSLTSWLSRTVHCDFNGSLVRGHLRRVGEHCDGQSETLPWREKERKTTGENR